MNSRTDDLRIGSIKALTSPETVVGEFPASPVAVETVSRSRAAIRAILEGEDDRLLIVVGPCSIHDPKAAIEYAMRLADARKAMSGELEIVMRVYFEKPRTTIGWKGLINDPQLDGSFKIDVGLRLARGLLLGVNELGLPTACEFLDLISPQYISDLVSWGAIGARTTESQIHRELASGLSCPVGFKNGTDGSVKIAIDAVLAAAKSHHFLGVTKSGASAIVETTGNRDCHVILRGGARPNYDTHSVRETLAALQAKGLPEKVMIDVSHANSGKDFRLQGPIVRELASRVAMGDRSLLGVMIESNLVEGRQDLVPGQALTYGQSITDACLGWEETREALEGLADAVRVSRERSLVGCDS